MKAMSFTRSLPFFLLPAVFLALIFWKLMPLLDWLGKPLFYSYTGAMTFFSIVLLMLAIGFYQKEKHPRGSLPSRFRLKKLSGLDWIWTLALAVILFLCYQFLDPLSEYIRLNWWTPPKFFFRLLDSGSGYLMEVPLRDNWIAPAFFLICACMQVIGEEFYFRGYILPRQEKAMGSITWLPHALLWTIYLCVQPWELPRAIIVAAAVALIAQRRQNTSITINARILAAIVALISGYRS